MSEEKVLTESIKSDKKRGRPPKNRPFEQPIQSAPIGAPLNDDSRVNRPQRIPIGSQLRLKVPQRAGYVRRWVNDRDSRIRDFELAGYTRVIDSNMPVGEGRSKDPSVLGATISKSVGRGDTAYLMEIPEQFYKEDQANKRKKRTELTQTITSVDPSKNQYGQVSMTRSHKF